MAEAKKETAKVIAKAAPAKAEPKKAEAEVKEAPKAETKAAPKAAAKPAKKTAAKKTTAKKTTAKKAATKTAAAKKATATTAKKPGRKPAVKEVVNFQFSGKSYTSADLVKICKDVWKYDLQGKEEDFKTVELYVKPEESTAYYVINGDVTGSFFI